MARPQARQPQQQHRPAQACAADVRARASFRRLYRVWIGVWDVGWNGVELQAGLGHPGPNSRQPLAQAAPEPRRSAALRLEPPAGRWVELGCTEPRRIGLELVGGGRAACAGCGNVHNSLWVDRNVPDHDNRHSSARDQQEPIRANDLLVPVEADAVSIPLGAAVATSGSGQTLQRDARYVPAHVVASTSEWRPACVLARAPALADTTEPAPPRRGRPQQRVQPRPEPRSPEPDSGSESEPEPEPDSEPESCPGSESQRLALPVGQRVWRAAQWRHC